MHKLQAFIPAGLTIMLQVSYGNSHNSQSSELFAGKDMVAVEELGSEQFRVTCQDGVKEIRSLSQITNNDVCLDSGFVARAKGPAFYVSENGEDQNCYIPKDTIVRLDGDSVGKRLNDLHVKTRLASYANLRPRCLLKEGLLIAEQFDFGITDGTQITWGIDLDQDPTQPERQPIAFVDWTSDEGDYIGGGLPKVLSTANGEVTVNVRDKNLITLNFDGDDYYNREFKAPDGEDLTVGSYEGATRYPFQDNDVPGISISGAGRGCNRIEGSFVIEEIIFSEDDSLEKLNLQFIQNCEGSEPALRGSVYYDAKPDGNQAILAGQQGDWISGDAFRLFTPEDATFSSRQINGERGVSFSLRNLMSDNRGSNYRFEFVAPEGEELTPGAYLSATRYPFQSPIRPGMSIGGSGRGCNTLTGDFRVHNISWDNENVLKELSVDFVQYCSNGQSAAYGAIRYVAE